MNLLILGLIYIASFISTSAYAWVDKNLSQEGKILFERLNQASLSLNSSSQEIFLGQQNAFLQGQGWYQTNNDLGSELQSDMFEVSQIHPAVLGLDFLEIGHWNEEIILEKIQLVHAQGGIITLSWHMPSLIDDGKGDGSFFDTTSKVVRHILPGGKAHENYLSNLQRLISFLKLIENIPVIFRPFHEHNGSWFWWGKKHCSKIEYISLWRFTVDFLKDKGVHNLLYAYSPDQIKNDYLERYPGDDYVDILGVDAYFKNPLINFWNLGFQPLKNWKTDIIWLLREADKRNKIPAITEFGEEGIKTDRFWTDYMGWPIEKAGIIQLVGEKNLPKRGISYLMLWRNDSSNLSHFFGPIPGHKENENFKMLLRKKIFKGLDSSPKNKKVSYPQS
jgi:mannan endo-1,4-beta-mannosidase